ncbi:hypothetical protein FHS34_001991 [Streptomyces echinatus]|uniref:Uncharacterized protein n=1 Tax=Streptomyces echinatus TaxID=67293 RepID=A0A7W9UPN5_9ACTN|nr:hypothetical protein [Streptomyces echinatus]
MSRRPGGPGRACRPGGNYSEPLEIDLVPVTDRVFAGAGVGAAFSEDYMPVVLSTLRDGTGCVCIGMRCTPKTE